MSELNARWSPANAPQKIAKNLRTLPNWLPKRISTTTYRLGKLAVDAMRDTTDANRYTGSLSESISAQQSMGGAEVTISPKVRRGKWDGGLILEMGTRPIARAPWVPIKRWAEFRGITAFPVWYKIRTRGVSPHPFLDRTLHEVEPMMVSLSGELLSEIARALLYDGV